ncbi:hypothetical protein AB4Z34_07060 [Ensifer sp. 2YAB10]|uniref:hypothetical protein n=1 Tax=Ensifer sp. 2TAB8 TaxID=3233006 RepID=UPI003F9119F1
MGGRYALHAAIIRHRSAPSRADLLERREIERFPAENDGFDLLQHADTNLSAQRASPSRLHADAWILTQPPLENARMPAACYALIARSCYIPNLERVMPNAEHTLGACGRS